MNKKNYQIDVRAVVDYLIEESDPERGQHVFAYTITISNEGSVAATLLSRHWHITNSEGEVKQIKGDGVVGEQPYIGPGQQFTYTSYAVIDTPIGSMYGNYEMIAEDGVRFLAPIKAFTLAVPCMLH